MISGDDRHMQMEKDEVAAPQKWIRFHDEVDTLTRRLNKLVPNANTGLQHSSVMPARGGDGDDDEEEAEEERDSSATSVSSVPTNASDRVEFTASAQFELFAICKSRQVSGTRLQSDELLGEERAGKAAEVVGAQEVTVMVTRDVNELASGRNCSIVVIGLLELPLRVSASLLDKYEKNLSKAVFFFFLDQTEEEEKTIRKKPQS